MVCFVSVNAPTEPHKDIVHIISPFDIKHSYSRNKEVALDLETQGLDFTKDEILLIGVGDAEYQMVINNGNIDASAFLYDIVEDKDIMKVGANLKFDLPFLRRNYAVVASNLWDVSRVDEVIFNGLYSNLDKNPTKAKMLYYKAFSLKSLVKRHLKEEMSKTVRNSFIGRKPDKPYTPAEILYLADDLKYPLRIKKEQVKLIKKYGLERVIELENNVVECIAEMEFNGVKLDSTKWAEIAKRTEKERDETEKELDEILIKELGLTEYKTRYYQTDLFGSSQIKGSTINWGSDVQGLEVLQKLKPEIKSTQEKEIATYKNEIHLINKLLDYKELAKSCNTYGLKYLNNINSVTSRIHPSLEQVFTNTGRLSCLRPNLQQVKAGSDYRSCFIAEPGNKLLGFDYSNQELRIIASGSGDKLWIQTFMDKIDLHGKLCELVFKISAVEVSQPFPFNKKLTYRTVQKTIDFMLAFGGSEHKLASLTGMSIEQARATIEEFFAIVPDVKDYLEGMGQFGVKYGYSRTMAPFGRIRWYRDWSKLHDPKIDNYEKNKLRGKIERASKNTPIQGTGADMMKYAMTKIMDHCKKANILNRIQIILQVHDELLFETKEADVELCKSIVTSNMLQASKEIIPNVPMEISCKVGDYWQK
jgi:DNA polymerase-1